MYERYRFDFKMSRAEHLYYRAVCETCHYYKHSIFEFDFLLDVDGHPTLYPLDIGRVAFANNISVSRVELCHSKRHPQRVLQESPTQRVNS